MIDLVLAADDFSSLKASLFQDGREACAVLLASRVLRSDGRVRLLVREIIFPTMDEYSRRSPVEAELTPNLVARVTKRARLESRSLIFAHSHPGAGIPEFSSTDDWGEQRLARFLESRHPEVEHAALVLSEGGIRARRLAAREEIRVISIGEEMLTLFNPRSVDVGSMDRFDRQIRAFGESGQKALSDLRVAIVGLGGTGSLVAQQMAHLGVREFLLLDPDMIESTNLNRVANATDRDIGCPKVGVAEKYIRKISPHASVESLQGDVTRVTYARRLLDVDLIFGCTDSHGSRAVLQQLAYQYMIPLIDMGVTIAAAGGRIAYVYGRAQLLSPGLACFACDGLLDAKQVRQDMMSPFERQADPYFQGHHEPAPAVMTLNGTVVSLATTMALSVIVGFPFRGRHLLYNAISSTVRTARAQPQAECYICSRKGAFARGDEWPLFAREA
jgi:molybdopterin/thiamine biosynthesis adenylyltransferase